VTITDAGRQDDLSAFDLPQCRAHHSSSKMHAVSENTTPEPEIICSVCGRPMILLHEIRRAFAENLYVFKCRPCGFSMTEPVSWTTRPR
jgi:hypothetical protein